MDNNKLATDVSSTIYPGAYIPILHDEDLADELKVNREGTVVQPLVNICEYGDCYTIEVCIPGLQREDFLINIHDHTLSISVLHKEGKKREHTRYRLHEFNYECFKREIILPKNADTERVKAEYLEGILHLHIPKTTGAISRVQTKVVVY